MLLSAVSVLVVAQSSSEIPEGLMNNPVKRRKVSWMDHILFRNCLLEDVIDGTMEGRVEVTGR